MPNPALLFLWHILSNFYVPMPLRLTARTATAGISSPISMSLYPFGSLPEPPRLAYPLQFLCPYALKHSGGE